ncbi:hypothetical protein IP69_18770 [Bosea sp. AAP35]|nr:hypothetical protein IP69_18770 [Bosea sp. AAP35]
MKVIDTFAERGAFCFSRRVPAIQPQFDRQRVVPCLHARSPTRAQTLASALGVQSEMVWALM